ncbi:MAG: hypothetical protein HYS98_06825 [Deltaproteobacteria bacterium]|nr:hypothetical protein [Deltaproteobacteria bacterium]
MFLGCQQQTQKKHDLDGLLTPSGTYPKSFYKIKKFQFTSIPTLLKDDQKIKKEEIFYSHYLQGLHSLNEEKMEVALTHLNEAFKINSKHLGLHIAIAETYLIMRQWDLSLRHAKAVLELDPQNKDAKLLLSEIYKNQKKNDAAIRNQLRLILL